MAPSVPLWQFDESNPLALWDSQDPHRDGFTVFGQTACGLDGHGTARILRCVARRDSPYRAVEAPSLLYADFLSWVTNLRSQA